MRKTLLLLFIAIINYSFCQKEISTNFTPGVKGILKKNDTILDFKSILFIFKGDTHLINNYLNLKRHIEKRFRRAKIKTHFNYELNSETPLESDLQKTPLKKYKKSEHDINCIITLINFKSWKADEIENRKQYFDVYLEIQDPESNLLQELKISVNTYYTIATKNKEISIAILDSLTK